LKLASPRLIKSPTYIEQNYPPLAKVTAPGHLTELITLTAYETVPSPEILLYGWVSPAILLIQAGP
jgi:hypothetical protein